MSNSQQRRKARRKPLKAVFLAKNKEKVQQKQKLKGK